MLETSRPPGAGLVPALALALALATPPVRAKPPPTAGASAPAAAAALAAPMSPPGAHAAAAPFRLEPCRLRGVPTEVLCGWLPRPLDPAAPQGTQIRLRVAVLPALARHKRPDPVVLLAGGPGQSAIGLADVVLERHRRLNQRRDIVLVDQRGTGESAPLTCPDERHLPMAEQLDEAAGLRRLAACREALEQLPHGDLRHYTTPVAMQDLDAVRQALGVARWNVIGASYGTRAGLDYLRQFPGSVRRAVLDGLAPPDMVLPASFSTDSQAALDALLAACAAEPGCERQFPQLAAQWRRLVESLPRRVELRHPMTGRRETVTLTRTHLLRAVRAPLYVPALASALPAAIAAAAGGEFDALGALAGALGGDRPGQRLAVGMHHAVVCSEDLPRLGGVGSDPPGRDYATLDRTHYQAACTGWPRATVPAAFYSLPAAPVPVLLLSGGADPATPPRHGERVARALGAQARHVVVPAAGHGVLSLPCMRRAAHEFLDAETDAQALKLPMDCARDTPRPLAYVPPDPARPAGAASASAATRETSAATPSTAAASGPKEGAR